MVLSKWKPTSISSVHDINKTWDDLFDSFFYRFPKETKPPIEAHSVYNDENTELIGVRVQMALAGFSKDDVKVWFDDVEGKLHISGNNLEKENILDRFKSDFDNTLVYSSALNVEEAEVNLKDGMLDVFIPLAEKKQKKVFLFGE